ncbi:MAG: hypothetical protein HYY93_00430 [Planctomycetes bacterium]|nr:hypothetical protein [Planctomycetota bacterium]
MGRNIIPGKNKSRVEAAVTLIELLVVVTIIAVVFGLGLAVLSQTNKDMGLRGAVGQVNSVLRFARATAINEHAPCHVEVDPKERRLVCVVKRTMGLWHCEDLRSDGQTTGAFSRDGRVSGGVPSTGRFGNGLGFEGKGGSVDCGPIPIYTSDQGLEFEAWVHQSRRVEQTVIEKKGEYALGIDKTGLPWAQVGRLKVTARGQQVPLHYWCHLRARYDGDDVRLYANDRQVGYAKGKVSLSDSGASLTLGSTSAPYVGTLDEVRVSALIASPQQEFRLPDHVAIWIGDAPDIKEVPEGEEVAVTPSPQKAEKIYFDGMGRLDAERHPGPFRLTLVSAHEKATITITRIGTVE